jgi:hypothetical protein
VRGAEVFMPKRLMSTLVGGGLVLLLLIQVIPYGRDHTNPPVRREPSWDSPQTRQLAVRACYDCHSNQTAWPWYTQVAPISWLAQYDVQKGRDELNFSELDRSQKEARESAESVEEGEMPPWYYVLAHPEASLSPAERQALIQGLRATLGGKAEQPHGAVVGDTTEQRGQDSHGRLK